MEKSYRKLLSRRDQPLPPPDVIDAAVSAAIHSVQRHSPYDVMCSWCRNNDKNHFQVTRIDEDDGSIITQINCKRCNEFMQVCHSLCYCQRYLASSSLETSYKVAIRNTAVSKYSKSIPMCCILEATVTLLHSECDGRVVCSLCNVPSDQIIVNKVDRLGFITGIQCPNCEKELVFSPLEESYIVQMLYHGQSDQDNVIERAKNREYIENLSELHDLLRRHSFYENRIHPEIDQEGCRVVDIDKQTGQVNEVEFVAPDYTQSLTITCRSGCYYAKYPSDEPSRYEKSYKEKIRAQLATDRANAQRRKAILSCTVLAGTAAILRRHNTDNTLCQNCKNDDHDFLDVKEIDDLGFITSVECVTCRQYTHAEQSTMCHWSRFFYEEVDETVKLERGDHVSWHRNLAYWHHGIVTRVDGDTVTLAEYVRRDNHMKLKESTRPRRDLSPTFGSGIPYRVTYQDCYTNEYTALRAERSIDEEQYHLLNRNCEHLSYWCKTGRPRSDQVATVTRSTWKTFLAFGLRIVNMLLLTAFQVIHEKREGNQKRPETFKLFEHILITVYMSIVFLLFLSWSLYTEHKKVKKLKSATGKYCCNRPPCVVSGLYFRVVTREVFAAAGPFFVIYYEDSIVKWLGTFLPLEDEWKKLVAISFLFFVVFFASYGLGAVLGTVFEYAIRRCSIRLRKSSRTRRESSREVPANIQMRGTCDNGETSSLPNNMQN